MTLKRRLKRLEATQRPQVLIYVPDGLTPAEKEAFVADYLAKNQLPKETYVLTIDEADRDA